MNWLDLAIAAICLPVIFVSCWHISSTDQAAPPPPLQVCPPHTGAVLPTIQRDYAPQVSRRIVWLPYRRTVARSTVGVVAICLAVGVVV